MLIGSYGHVLDAKGRIFIPSKWREDLGSTVVITLGLVKGARCLYGMSTADWELFSKRLDTLPITDFEAQAIRRRLYAVAASCETDKQGRILLPVPLREMAGLGKEITLVGVGNHIEFWDTAAFLADTQNTDQQYASILAHLQELRL